MKKREVCICPVTFVGNDLCVDRSLNESFIQPYALNTVAALNRSVMFDEFKKDSNVRLGLNEKDFNNILKRSDNVSAHENDAIIEAIYSYIVNNCCDVVYTTLIKFMETEIGKFSIGIDGIKFVSLFLGNINLRETIKRCVVFYNVIPSNYTIKYNFNTVHLSFNEYCIEFNTLASKLLSCLSYTVFDPFITNMVFESANANGLDALFKILFIETYGEEPGKPFKESNLNVSTAYTFITSILREKMYKYIEDVDKAFKAIFNCAANMAYYYPDYSNINHAVNPEISTYDMIMTNPMMQQNIKIEEVNKNE